MSMTIFGGITFRIERYAEMLKNGITLKNFKRYMVTLMLIVKIWKMMRSHLIKGRKNENLVWTDNQIDCLVHCLLEQARNPGMKLRGGGFKGRAMAIIERKMIDKFGPEFTKEKNRNKLKYVKPNLSTCKEILNTSGFSWDPAMKCIDVNDNVWRDYIQISR